jgi:hypothetical protein
MLRFHVLLAERSGGVLSGAEHDELRVMRLSGGVSGVGWVVAGRFEKERLRETGPLFFLLSGVVGVLAGGLEGTPISIRRDL